MDNQQITPKAFFDAIDFTSDGESVPEDSGIVEFSGNAPQARKKEKNNPFSVIEQKLCLPEGSTAEALDALKKLKRCADGASQGAQAVQKEANDIVARQQQADLGSVAIDQELLRADRERIRKESFELYDSVKEIYETMRDAFVGLATPTPAMCTAMATMVNSMQQTLEKLVKVNQMLREETEHYTERYVKPELNPDAPPEEQEYDYNPAQMADLVERWTIEAEENVAKQLELEVQARDAAKMAGDGGVAENLIGHEEALPAKT